MDEFVTVEKPNLEEIPQVSTGGNGHSSVRELPEIIDAAKFVEQNIPEPTQLIHGILHQGSKMVLGGGSKSYKTWFLIDLALSVSCGIDWCGFPTTQGKALYINLEIQGYWAQRRLKTVKEAKKTILEEGQLAFWNLRGHSTEIGKLMETMLPKIINGGYGLVVLDPIYKLYGECDENNVSGVMSILNEGERLAVETGAAVVFGTHFSKGNQAAKYSIDRISGSGAFARDPDTILILTQHDEEDCYTLESTLRNFKPMPPLVVRWDFPLFIRDDDLDPAQLKPHKTGPPAKHHTVEELMAHVPTDKPIDKNELKTKANKAGIPQNSVFPLIDQGIEKGLLYEWLIKRPKTNPKKQIARFAQPQDPHDLHGLNL